MTTWAEHQEWERQWWGACTNTFAEEAKQITYANRMGLVVVSDPTGCERWPVYDLGDKSVLDIGCGPVSMLLKTETTGEKEACDPCRYPEWVEQRYAAAGIDYRQMPGEDVQHTNDFDEVWLYNVLQHTVNAETIARTARQIAKTVRVFEWVNVGECMGHPTNLDPFLLDNWYDGRGVIEQMTGENQCVGTAYYGVFGGA